MSELDAACSKVLAQTSGAVACGVVDLDSGIILGLASEFDETVVLSEVVAEAAIDLFRGALLGRLEEVLRRLRGTPDDGLHYFEEVQLTSRDNLHFGKTISEGRALLVLITNKSTSVGMGWAQMKSAIPDIEQHVP